MHGKPLYPCPQCQIGHLQAGKATYARMYHGLLIAASDILAWTCDVCHFQEFDHEALARLEALIGQFSAVTNVPRGALKVQSVDAVEVGATPRLKP